MGVSSRLIENDSDGVKPNRIEVVYNRGILSDAPRGSKFQRRFCML